MLSWHADAALELRGRGLYGPPTRSGRVTVDLSRNGALLPCENSKELNLASVMVIPTDPF